jgi:serine/threonine protein kinase
MDILEKKGIFHSDIKEENIVLRSDGYGKMKLFLIDFGGAVFKCDEI